MHTHKRRSCADTLLFTQYTLNDQNLLGIRTCRGATGAFFLAACENTQLRGAVFWLE